MYLVDTQIVSYILRRSPLMEPYRPELESGAPMFVSVQTVAELMLGAELDGWGAKRRAALTSLIESTYSILPIDLKTASCYVPLKAGSSVAGHRLSDSDAWIAATALQYGLALVTHDRDMTVCSRLGVNVICRV